DLAFTDAGGVARVCAAREPGVTARANGGGENEKGCDTGQRFEKVAAAETEEAPARGLIERLQAAGAVPDIGEAEIGDAIAGRFGEPGVEFRLVGCVPAAFFAAHDPLGGDGVDLVGAG